MNVTLYSVGCPSCRVLETMLNENHINYTTIMDTKKMDELGITSVPQLDVDGERMSLAKAIQWMRLNKYAD